MTRRSHRTLLGVAALGLLLLSAGPALAAWRASATGNAVAAASSLSVPAGGAATPAGQTSMAISWTAPTAGAQGAATYLVSGGGTCSALASTGGCTVTGLAAGTQYTFTLKAQLSNWASASTSGFNGQTLSALTITSVVRDSGNKKVHFTGTGAVGSSAVVVTICSVNSFPCSAGSSGGTSSTASSPSASWTSGQSSTNLSGSATYYAQATQGSNTSAVFTFSTTNL